MTSSIPRSRRRAPFAVAVGLVALLAVFAPVSAASAHDQLISSDPAADAALDALPAEITLTFSAELLGDGGANEIAVTDAAGTILTDGATVVDGVNATQALAGAASGPVRVLWRVVSSDGHPISGEFFFTVESAPTPTPAATPTASESASPEPMMTTMTEPAATPSSTPAPTDDASASTPLPWVIGVIVVVVVIGVVLYLLVIRPRGRDGGAQPGTLPSADE